MTKPMRIKAPIVSVREVKRLIACGVDEVYCGVLSAQWQKQYSALASINRVDRQSGNVVSYDLLKEISAYAHAYHVKVYVTLNGLYTAGQYSSLRHELDCILSSDVDGLIVADIGMLRWLYQAKIKKEIHASVGATTFNSSAVRFLQDLGVKRIALPRALRKEEIQDIVTGNNDMQFEVIAMNGRCQNIDGFCTFHHGIADLRAKRVHTFLIRSSLGNKMQELLLASPRPVRTVLMAAVGQKVCSTACTLPYDSDGEHKNILVSQEDSMEELFSCAGCDMYDFMRWGVACAKVVGRTFPLQRKVKDVRYLRHLIDQAAKKSASPQAVKECAQRVYTKVYGYRCRNKCYYRQHDTPKRTL